MTTQPDPCGLNGCTNPTDPDSLIGRCATCTVPFVAEIRRLQGLDAQRAAARARRAPVDAILITQARWRDDHQALDALLANADIPAVAVELAGLVFLTIKNIFGPEAVDGWLEACLKRARRRAGEDDTP